MTGDYWSWEGSRSPGPRESTASVKAPLIYPLRLCTKGSTSVTLGCLVRDYFPDPVTVTWYTDASNVSTMNFPAKTLNSSELQVTTSRMTAWGPSAKKNFFCHVTHSPSSTSKNITVPVPRGNVTQPTVKLLHSSCDPTAFHPTIQLYCFIYGHIPENVTVAWLKNGVEMPNIFPRDILLKKEGKLASTYSELNITQQDWASESTFSCKVISQGETYLAHARKCADYEPRGVNTYLIPPSPLDLFVLKTPKLICLVVDLESEDRVTVTWTQEHNNEPVGTASERVTKHVNATTSITSTLSVDAKDWIDGKGYRCIVKHPDLPKSIVRAITKAPGKRSAPKVYMFLPPEVEEDKRTLTCLIQNFFPVDISVQWLQNGKLVQNMPHSTTAPLKDNGANPAFFIFSRLEVTKEHWERNDQFTCRVIHEALPEPRTLEKTVSKSPELDLQELCTEETESEELEGLWTSTYIFITLFLLSVSYGATVTLIKVTWVSTALTQGAPQTFHDYANILQPRA